MDDEIAVAGYIVGKVEVLKKVKEMYLNGASRVCVYHYCLIELRGIELMKNADNTKESKTEVGERTETKPE